MQVATQHGTCYDDQTIVNEVCAFLAEHAVPVTAAKGILAVSQEVDDNTDPRHVLMDMAATCGEGEHGRDGYNYHKDEKSLTNVEVWHLMSQTLRTHRRRADIPTLVRYELAVSTKYWHAGKVKMLLDDDAFCKRFVDMKQNEEGMTKTDEAAIIPVYEQLIKEIRKETKATKCQHRYASTLVDYATALSKDICLKVSLRQSVDRGIIRCLVGAARALAATPKGVCKCRLTHISLYWLSQLIAFMYGRLGMANFATRFLWEITGSEHNLFTQVEAVNLLVLLFSMLHGDVPTSISDLNLSEGMALYMPPRRNTPLRPNAKILLSQWRTRMMKYAKKPGAVWMAHIEDMLQSAMMPIDKVLKHPPLADVAVFNKQPSGEGLMEWIKYILHLIQTRDYDKACSTFLVANQVHRGMMDKVVLAANHCALLMAMGKSVAPALYPLQRISRLEYIRPGWAPTPLSKVLLSCIRADRRVLERFTENEKFLLTPEARTILFHDEMKKGLLTKDEILRTIYSTLPCNLSTPEGAAVSYGAMFFPGTKNDPQPVDAKKKKKKKKGKK
eukprot:TRINITY_DN7398_c1_g1_i3.p1 TRINITY_DN7398_c1_g1~~TRINITY_DN7398_c1_g1_i3.p1  ORF type:complete len:654 (+),score=248.23 TRINITY_DN7398_c1_g1_i3:289-1962(+)